MEETTSQIPEASPAAASVAADATTSSQQPPAGESASSPCGLACYVGIAIAAAVVAFAIVRLVLRRRRAAPAAADSAAPGSGVEIYVGNLSYDMGDAELRREFARYGVVASARVVGHRASGKSKGYGFVTMPHRNEAEIAISKLNGREIMGRKLRVNESRQGLAAQQQAAAPAKATGRRPRRQRRQGQGGQPQADRAPAADRA